MIIESKLIQLLLDTSKSRSLRASFRKSKNLPLSEASEVWSFVYSTEDIMRPDEELALYTTFIIASIDFQKNPKKYTPTEFNTTLGEALKTVSRQQVNAEAFSSKMARLVDSQDYLTFSRRLISLLAQGTTQGDYYKDLYLTLVGFQSKNKQKTLQRLAKNFYKQQSKEK